MMKIINELKKFIWVIVILAMVGLNVYSINLNTKHCNRNAQATVCLADGVNVLTDATTTFVRRYIKDRTIIKNKLDTLDRRDLDNLTHIVKNSDNIGKLLNNQAVAIENLVLLNKYVEKAHKKPSYKYLKSVTVYVTGESFTYAIVNSIMQKITIAKWCGTGVVVKVDSENTYVLTNKHVAGGYKSTPSIISIKEDKKSRVCEIIKLHKTQDLALLKIKGIIKNKNVVNGLAFPNITEKVYTVGHSLARPYMYGEGVFSGTVIQHDIYQLPVIGGQSGSGVFNANGELLGLVYSLSGTRNGLSTQWDFTRANVVKGIYVKTFLEENL